jgi:fatty-acyl-CoA synthase
VFDSHAALPTVSGDALLSYECGTGSIELLGKCVGQVLDDAAEKWGDRDAMVVRHQSLRYSYAQLKNQVEDLAKGLIGLGISKGDRVGIWSTNCAEWVVSQFATAKAGAILVNVNPSNGATESDYVVRQSGCTALIYGEAFRDLDYPRMVREICGAKDPPPLQHLISIKAENVEGAMSWTDLIGMGRQAQDTLLRAREAELGFDDVINIQYTSGTTGRPKGAMLSHHNLVNNARLVADRLRFNHEDRLCIPVPFYHCFGMVLSNMVCVVSGAAMVVPGPRFDPEMTLRAVHDERCTALHGVPTMFIAELEHASFNTFELGSLKTGIMAGAPCPIELMKRVQSEMHCEQLTIAYGLTEASPVITQTAREDPVEVRAATVGRPLPHTEIKIVDSTGKIVPRGMPGELCARGYMVMKGFYNDPAATEAVIDKDGWLHTGDLSMMDDRGYCRIVGRARDVIIRGGENIYPREIEEFLYTCPGISAAQVVGIPDRKYGEQVIAWIKLEEGSALTEARIRAFCEGKIARFKIPKHIKFVREFPLTVTGKVQKFRIREMMIEELGLAGEAAIETA